MKTPKRDKNTAQCAQTNRSAAQPIEYWATMGAAMEANPDLPYAFVQQVLFSEIERQAGKLSLYNLSRNE